jgi:CheY-like chemotaxis protein
LLDNAAKFSPPGTPVDVDVTRAGDVARIAVRDRGPGVAPEARVRIFDRFEQAHAERHHGGLGLGLYISRQLVELHGGAIAYEAPSDGGARFVVQLPLAEPATAASPGAGPVLVVDDDDTIRSLMAEALSDEGYETVEAKDGAVALDFVRAYSPRLILLDMRMPGMNGWEFAEEYRKLPGPHAPIVVVTAGADGALKASQIHADAYVAKPFRIDDLVDTVARHLQTIA